MPFQFKSEKELVRFVINQKLKDWQTELFKQNANAVQVHSQGQLFYKLDTLFPNELEESKEHRILAFESVTEASFGRAANNVNRIFKNSSYSVEASEKTIDLASQHSYEGQNFYQWFLDQWVKWALKEDPNSRIVVYPPEYTDYKSQVCEFIASEHIKHISEDLIIFISEKESEVDIQLENIKVQRKEFFDQRINGINFIQSQANTFTPKICKKIVRPVYHAFFKGEGLYRIEQLKTKSAKGEDYEIEFFPIKVDFMPVTDAGGEKTTLSVNKSFLHPFVAFGNLALLQHSQHTAVNFMFSFPKMSEIQNPCDDPACQAGFVECKTEKDIEQFGSNKKCLRCGGSGFMTNQTPYKTYFRKIDPQGVEGSEKLLDIDDVKYYTPDVSILDYSKDEWKGYLEQAEKAVYISQRVQTGNVEAAKSKEIDREDLYSFLARVGQTYFSKLRFVLQSFENYNVGSPTIVTVNIPYSFAILSEGEAFAALKDILSSNVPVMLKASQVESFINKFVSQSSPVRRFIDVLRLVDPLLYYTSVEIASFKMNSIVSAEQFSNHVFAYPVLQSLYYQDKGLFLLDTNVIVAKVNEELKKYKPEPVKSIKDQFVQK